ncbi:N-lysine methyltransferase KMT5A isoform X2 [Gallus gallus]|uniref:N-lysine methyltransferase KMT5A isoform X2 n=1 Tax=Gallus gallus TaxID=9031 RepID=UPI001AEA977F|nr:N-lysine methyltransferase KMT5A isoform X2 [Gallus gallus]
MSIKLINSDSSVMLQTINRGRDDRTVGRDEKNRLNGAHVPATALCMLHIKAQRSAVMCSTFSTESICTSPYDRGQKVAVYGHSRLGEENVFTGQSKIYSYLNPNKSPGARSPLQEENSVMYHEVKCQGKALTETNKKGDEKKNGGNIIEGAMKPEDQKDKESGCNTSVLSSDQKKQETVETEKTLLPSDCAGEASAKPAQKKMVKAKRGPRRKTQGRAPNRKVTDYYPVRRSSRKSKSELETEERRKIDELITSGKEEGMKIDYIDGKGRGVIATKHFNRGEFVVEYHGDLIEITDAKKREAVYAQDPSTGCYMYYFQYLSKTYCVDATKETNRLGRLINHSKCGNCQTKLHDIDGVPHLILIASRDIKAGEELLYDYGDRSKASIEAHPWLKH